MGLKRLSDKELLRLAMMASGSPSVDSPEYHRTYQRARRNIPKLTTSQRYKLTKAQLEVYGVMRELMGAKRPRKR